jgi:hypothetical protein
MADADETRPRLKFLLESLRSLLSGGRTLYRRLRRKQPPPPADPCAYVPAPLRRGPKGRSGAAVAEIEEDSFQSFPPRSP